MVRMHSSMAPFHAELTYLSLVVITQTRSTPRALRVSLWIGVRVRVRAGVGVGVGVGLGLRGWGPHVSLYITAHTLLDEAG